MEGVYTENGCLDRVIRMSDPISLGPGQFLNQFSIDKDGETYSFEIRVAQGVVRLQDKDEVTQRVAQMVQSRISRQALAGKETLEIALKG